MPLGQRAHQFLTPAGCELVERLVACTEPAIGLDEMEALRPPDRTVLVTVEVRHQAVMKGVHGESDFAPGQFAQRETHAVEVHRIVAGTPHSFAGQELLASCSCDSDAIIHILHESALLRHRLLTWITI